MNYVPSPDVRRKIIRHIVIYGLPCLLLFFIANVMVNSNRTLLERPEFVVDQQNRLYLGFSNRVEVYENGSKIKEMDSPASKIRITQDDNLLMFDSGTITLVDTDGNLIEQDKAGNRLKLLWDQYYHPSNTYVSPQSVSYESSNLLGDFKIYYDDGGSRTYLYTTPATTLFRRVFYNLSLVAFVVCIFWNVLIFLPIMLQDRKKQQAVDQS